MITKASRHRDWLWRLPLSCATGCLFFTSVATFDIWPLAWCAFVPLLWAIRDCRPRAAFVWGWIAGLVTNVGGFYWIAHLLVRFGEMPMAAALPLFLLLAAYQGLHWGIFAFLIRKTLQGRPRLPVTLLAPVFMTTLELLVPFVFDWYIAISQAWVVPVIQVAELAGPLGVTFLVMMVNGTIFDTITAIAQRRSLPRKALATVAAIMAVSLLFGIVRIHQVEARRKAAPKLATGIVQGNIGIVRRTSLAEAVNNHRVYLEQSWLLQRKGARLLIWPESAYPFTLDRAQTRDFPDSDPRKVMRGLKVPLIFGASSYSRTEPYPYNTAFMMQSDGRIVGRYDKNYPLIFGEYIPFYEYMPNFKKWFPAASNFARGKQVTTFPWHQYRIGPMICYEDIITAFGRRLAKQRPNLLVNITNDAWFGRSSEPYEHLALSVYRAVELRLDLVRAVNTGVSALIDATGRVVAQTSSKDPRETPRGTAPDTMLVQAALMPPPATVYTTVGDLFGYLNLASALVLVGVTLQRTHKSGRRRRQKA